MARRGRYTGGFKFYQALALPTSTRLAHCYAMHGKGSGSPIGLEVAVRILAIDRSRSTRWEDGSHKVFHGWACPALAGVGSWRLLGWCMPDGSMPLGEYDAVDPDLAQFDHLPDVNTPHYTSQSTPLLSEDSP